MTWDGEWTARSISERVRAGVIAPHAAVDESLARIAAGDARLSAFRSVTDQRARAEAGQATQGPLAGVPIAIKDTVPVAGEPMRIGSLATSDEPQPSDHPVVARLRSAGAVVVGITNVPELCTFATTDGAGSVTRNPWNTERTPGGSSGGSAAAVASGMVPIAHGTDGMGSIRIPGAATGIVGLKPGAGVVPAELGSTNWFGLAENGVFATTVDDAALMLAVIADHQEFATVSEPERRLRVGVAFRPPVTGVTLDREHGLAAAHASALLRREGHSLEHLELGAGEQAVNAAAISALARWFAGVANESAGLDPAALQPRNRTHAAIGRVALRTPAMSDGLRDTWRRRAEAMFADIDLLITPALAAPPIAATTWHRRSWLSNVMSNIAYAPYAAPWNLAGYPAMVVPMGTHSTVGTPVAAQLVGPPGSEAMLLGAAATIERVQPWRRTAP